MKTRVIKILCLFAAMLLCIGFMSFMSVATWAADTYSATSMNLLHYEGEVQILNPEGEPRFVLENIRFDSGETLITGKDSTASVELDEERIVTLDSQTTVEFVQEGDSMKMNLKEGAILLDVGKKLDQNESLDIATSNMTVGIRGTTIYIIHLPKGNLSLEKLSESTLSKIQGLTNQDLSSLDTNTSANGDVTVFSVFHGNADISWKDNSGGEKRLNVSEGQKAMITGEAGTKEQAGPVLAYMEMDDLTDFISKNLTESQNNDVKTMLSASGKDSIDDPYSPEGDWLYYGTVTLTAQSASKMFDGTPLTQKDIVVSCLPVGFMVEAETSGSQTEVGTSSNPISKYIILNYRNEDVTAHFKSVETVDGQLVVDAIPVTIETSSATKAYDGTPLTSKEVEIKAYSGSQEVKVSGQNISYINTQPFMINQNKGTALNTAGEDLDGAESNTLYGVVGEVLVHGTNPVTEETREASLKAGQKMTIRINDEDEDNSIVFEILMMKEDEIPLEVLRIYADNPDILEQACKEAKWDLDKVKELIALLPETDAETVVENGVNMRKDDNGTTLQDYTNVRINIDTDITEYAERALEKEEIQYVQIALDPTIEVTTTGTQTDVGESENTYTINWGNAEKKNYAVTEKLGTLKVTPAPLTVTTGSDSKVYDGTALTCEDASIMGLAAGESATVVTTGSQTNVGKSDNTYRIEWGTADPDNYTISTENMGTLEVTRAPLTITTGSATGVYNGTALTSAEGSITGLAAGESATVITTGSQTNAGSSQNTYRIDWGTADPDNYYIAEENLGTITVTPAPLTITTGSASKEYDGTALTSTESSITGLAEGDSVTVITTGSQTDVGSSENTYEIDWGSVNPENYTIASETLGTLTVTPAQLTITTGSASKVYDGTALTSAEASITGLAAGDSASVITTGSQTDVGSSANTYMISWGNVNPDNYTVTESLGTLTVNPAAATVTITGNKGSLVYNGTEQKVEGYTVSISNEVYKETDFTFSGEAAAKGTDTGTYPMSLTADQFANSNENFYVTFEVTAGELEITKLAVAVNITGNSDSREYNGAEQEVEGYTVSTSDALYTEDGITFSGSAVAKGTIIDTYPMGLAADQFTNNNDNFDVTFSVTDGGLEITPYSALITFKAKDLDKTYDGTALQGEVEVVGVPEGFIGVGLTNAEQKNAGSSEYAVAEYGIYTSGTGEEVTEYFSNITTESGTLTVTPAEVTVTVTGNTVSKEYNGTEQKTEGYAVLISNDLYTEDDFTFSGTAVAKGTVPDTYLMGLSESLFTNTNDNFDVTFSVTDGGLQITPNTTPIVFTAQPTTQVYNGSPWAGEIEISGLPDGFNGFGWSNTELTNVSSISYEMDEYAIYTDSTEEDVTAYFTNIIRVPSTLEVTARPVTVTITGHTDSKVYNGEEQQVEGYEVAISDDLYKAEDFVFIGEAAYACGTDADTYPMGLTQEMFMNNNANFAVTFDVTDGGLEITKLPVTVQIEGNADSMGYNDKEQTVNGYSVSIFDESELYTESDFIFSGTAVAKGKKVGTYVMGLAADQFKNNNKNFDVTFEVYDGQLTITKVYVVFNVRCAERIFYDGFRHPDGAGILLCEDPNDYLSTCVYSELWIPEDEISGDTMEATFYFSDGTHLHLYVKGGGVEPGEYQLTCSYGIVAGSADGELWFYQDQIKYINAGNSEGIFTIAYEETTIPYDG